MGENISKKEESKMKELIVSGAEVKKMTSLEISELVESRHDNVKRTIKTLASGSVIELPQTEVIKTATKPIKVYLLDKRSSLIVVAQLCPEFTARIVDRWQELEERAELPKALPQNYKEALLQLVEQVEANEQLQLTIAEQEPTVKAYDRMCLADGLLNITNTAKTLQINPNQRLFAYMASNGWIYRRVGGKGWVAYQDRIAQGYMTHKVTTVQTSDGREKIVEQVLVTPKGIAKLAKVFEARP